MNFNTLYQKSVSAKKYEFNIEPYIEENPDFSEPAKYLRSIIEPISTFQCINDVINTSKEVIVPRILHKKQHIFFEVHDDIEIDYHKYDSKNNTSSNALNTNNSNHKHTITKYNNYQHTTQKQRKYGLSSYNYFGSLIYLYLYENYPQIRKYLHKYNIYDVRSNDAIIEKYRREFNKLNFTTFDNIDDYYDIFEHPDNVFCRIDDGSFSGSQFSDSLNKGNNLFICSTLYDDTIKNIAEDGLNSYTINDTKPKWLVDSDDSSVIFKNDTDTYGKGYKFSPNNGPRHTTIDGEYKVKLRHYEYVPNNLDLYASNIIEKCLRKDTAKNNVYYKYDSRNSSRSNIISTLSYSVDDIHHDESPLDQHEYFYFEHKYPDSMSITQTPLNMPTYYDEIIDPDDIDNHKMVSTYNEDYTYDNNLVSIISGIDKKINAITGKIVNDDDVDDIVGFYSLI